MFWALLACLPPSSNTTADTHDSDTAGAGDSGSGDSAGEDSVGSEPVASETEGNLNVPFTLAASGAGSRRLDSVELANNVGILTLKGTAHQGVAYQDHDWQEAGFHLYDVLSVADDGSDLGVTYLYCSDADLPYAYTESFSIKMGEESVEGSCAGVAASTTAAVRLPALTAMPEPFDPGVEFTSGELANGEVTLGDTTYALHPFNTVDCTDCPGGPWYELHSLIVAETQACFVIGYLFPDDPTWVQWEYGLCLPSLQTVSGRSETNWTGEVGGPPPPWRPAPPFRHR